MSMTLSVLSVLLFGFGLQEHEIGFKLFHLFHTCSFLLAVVLAATVHGNTFL